MTDNDPVCLQFNEFEKIVKSSWQELQMGTGFCDVTLACEDKQIEAHKFIISSFSPVLRTVLKLHPNPHPLIYLRKVKYKDLQNIISFMYQGEVSVTKEDLSSFLKVAQDLNVKGLVENNIYIESCKSKEEKSSESTHISHQDIAVPLKMQKNVENQQEASINDNPIYEHFMKKFENLRKLSTTRIQVVSERAEDLGIRERVKGNTKGCIPNKEHLSESTHIKVIAPSLERKIIVGSQQGLNVNVNPFAETLAEFEKFVKNEDTISSNPPTEIMEQKCDEDKTQNAVSTAEDKHFCCKKCGKWLVSRAGLKYHNKLCKEDLSSFLEVSEDLNTEAIIGSNIENETQNAIRVSADKGFCCKKCGKWLFSQNGLNYHNKSRHEGVKYPCTECNYKATQKGSLKQHVISSHDGVRYSCTECNYKASFKQRLTLHVASVHKGVVYLCAKCTYQAKYKDNLNRHVAAAHEGLRPFNCDQCDYRAAQKVSLKFHLQKKHNIE